MRSATATAFLLAIALVPNLATAQQNGERSSSRGASGNGGFLQAGTWWNLYFEERNSPLQRGQLSINAVKVLDVQHQPWIQIAFPATESEHQSIFGPAARAHENDQLSAKEALADWEKTVSSWRIIWVNLDFVVHISKVGSGPVPDLPSASP